MRGSYKILHLWSVSLKNGASVYGTTINKQKRMEKINPGDFLICYMTKLSRFVGLLEVTSKSFLDDSPIWKENAFPVRVNVRLIQKLESRKGILVPEIRNELSIFDHLKNPEVWNGFFLNSLNSFPEKDAQIIIKKLRVSIE